MTDLALPLCKARTLLYTELMADNSANQRKRKRLLVASVGVATVSFLAVQAGCEEPRQYTVANLLAPPDFGSAERGDAAQDASPLDATPDALPASGNLVMPPLDAAPHDAKGHTIATSGNLIPVPGDAALDALWDAQPSDAQPSDAQPSDAKADSTSDQDR
ncbi:MAG TPA: hypothetical protein VFZ61_03470 [Polyangiales bacterium]